MDVRTIRIATLERYSGIDIEKWIADWNDDDAPVSIVSQTEILIGDVDYAPIKWKCAECGRWNYELTFMDPTGAMAVCQHCPGDIWAEF